MKNQKYCIVFVANRGYALTSSRLPIIKKFLSSGWEVIIATAADKESRILQNFGVHLEEVKFFRGGVSPIKEILSYKRLCDVFKKWQPNIIHNFHAKPVIYGTIAARKKIGSAVRIVNTITGLGHAFVVGGMPAKLASFGYKNAINQANINIFQNRDDLQLFLVKKWVIKSKACLIASSGVDLKRFHYFDRSGRHKQPVVVMLGRLLRQKGIPDFIEVAKLVKQKLPDAQFLLAGEYDPAHPDSVDMDWLIDQKDITYLGHLDDVLPILKKSDLLLFPSSYREGVPRVILEAAATGLPIVAFDVPGVREAVIDEETGYLVPFRDIHTMVKAVNKLLKNRELRINMGKKARQMIEALFDQKIIIEKYFEIYRNLGANL